MGCCSRCVERCRKTSLGAGLVVGLGLCSLACSIASLVWAVLLKMRLDQLQANMVGDPEKEFMDECMRDHEGLSIESEDYLAQQRTCIADLRDQTNLQWLPRVRLPVDERVCDPADLCSSSDPGQCADTSEYGNSDYAPGDVTKCYNLIDQYKAERTQKTRVALLEQVEQDCTRDGRWTDYSNAVELRYCMWKHFNQGICTNSMRSTCPEDTSCCPVAQNLVGANAIGQPARPNVYQCRQSPTDGLFCQHVDDFVPGSNNSLCTTVSCPTFKWCLDLVDVPGLCLGPACQDYWRGVVYVGVLVGLATLGLFFDLIELLILVRCHVAPIMKTSCNMFGATLKLLGFTCCLAGGVRELVEQAIESSCFNAAGNESAVAARAGIVGFLVAIGLTTLGSFLLAPLSAHWGSHLSSIPYVKVQPESA